MPTKLAALLERVAARGDKAVEVLIGRFASSTSTLTLLRDLPIAIMSMTRPERAQLASLHARLAWERIGPCERALGRVGRWMDTVWARCRLPGGSLGAPLSRIRCLARE